MNHFSLEHSWVVTDGERPLPSHVTRVEELVGSVAASCWVAYNNHVHERNNTLVEYVKA